MPGIATSNVVPSGFGVGNGDSDAKAGSAEWRGFGTCSTGSAARPDAKKH
jgi:hypothetical protein